MRLVTRPVVQCGVHALCPLALEYAKHETNSPVKQIPCWLLFTLGFQHGHVQGKQVINVQLFSICLRMPGVNAAAQDSRLQTHTELDLA